MTELKQFDPEFWPLLSPKSLFKALIRLAGLIAKESDISAESEWMSILLMLVSLAAWRKRTYRMKKNNTKSFVKYETNQKKLAYIRTTNVLIPVKQILVCD